MNNHRIEHSMSYIYVGITKTASGSFNMTINARKEKAWRALNAIQIKISKFQLKSALKYLIVSSIPLHCRVVKYGVHSVITAILIWTNIQKNPYAQNSADTFYMYIEKHQQMHVEQNWADTHWLLTFKREHLNFWITLNETPSIPKPYKPKCWAQKRAPYVSWWQRETFFYNVKHLMT